MSDEVVLGGVPPHRPTARIRLPDWLNPWWAHQAVVASPMNPDSAREAILKASGRLRGPLGRPWFSRTLVVFRRSWFHYQPWVVANISVQGSATGSAVSIRVARTWFMAGFMTLFAVFAFGVPIVFFVASLGSNQLQGGPAWWTYPLWVAQDAGIYGAVMAANSFFARRDRDWLVARIGSLVEGTAIGEA